MLIIMKKYSRLIFHLVIVIMLAPKFVKSAETPELGDPYSQALSLKTEKIIGLSSYKRLQNYNQINNNPLVSSYISYLGNKLSRNIMDDNRKYTFFIVNSEQVNAFAIPGGFIGINSGLIILTENEAQLAGVVAHEISHVKLRHSAEMIANSSMNSIPMWIGIMAGIFAGNAESSMAAMRLGIGQSAQKNINLIRENEIEADDYGIEIMTRSNYDLKEMANLFKNMGQATGDIQRELSYLSTHPMYENRISHIQNKSKLQNKPIKNSTKDYFYIKTILEVETTSDINSSLKSIPRDNALNLYKRSLLYYKKSDYIKSEKEISIAYSVSPNNIYIAILYAKALAQQNKLEESLNVLNKIKNIYPHNSIISFIMSEILIENNYKLDYAEKLMKMHKDYFALNPNFLRLISKLYTLKNNKYESALYLSDYYVLLNDIDLAVEVLNNSIRSSNINSTQKKILASKKDRIICENPRRLQPIFSEKDCY
tara:strand:+ start:18 stop:1466 length:1449 start_codon:yes stop_codon:yes gene_type:complete